MKKKNHMLSFLLILLLVGSIITLGAVSGSSEKEVENATCRSQKSNDCSDKKQPGGGGDVIMDNFSRQFMFLISSGR